MFGKVVLVGGLVLATASLGAPAQAAAKPPAASQLRVVQRADHQLAVQFAVPVAFYHPGAGSVVRLTGGRTPAASPSKGYAVPTDGRHVSRTAATLLASQDYTFAVWIRDHGVYSKRISITTRTLADTTRPAAVTGLTAKAVIGQGHGEIHLSWTGDHSERMDYVRIVRNTKPTTTGGFAIAPHLAAGTETFNDWDVGFDSAANNVQSGAADEVHDFTQTRFYYFVIERDLAGNFSQSYANASDVLGTRVLSGTVATSGHHTVTAYGGGQNGLGVLESASASLEVTSTSGSRAFALRVPPGLYTVCDRISDDSDSNDRCWVVNQDGTTSTTPYPVTAFPDAPHVPAPSIDVTQGDYSAIRFTGGS